MIEIGMKDEVSDTNKGNIAMTGKGVVAAVGKLPRDPDVIQEYEFRQQQLVKSIVEQLHRDHDEEDNYVKRFGLIAENLLFVLRGEPGTKYVRDQVLKPIEDFTPHPTERLYLTFKVFEKVFNTIASSIHGDYLALQYGD